MAMHLVRNLGAVVATAVLLASGAEAYEDANSLMQLYEGTSSGSQGGPTLFGGAPPPPPDDQADNNEGDEGDEGDEGSTSPSPSPSPTPSPSPSPSPSPPPPDTSSDQPGGKSGNEAYGEAKRQIENSFRSEEDSGDNGQSDGATIGNAGSGQAVSGEFEGHGTWYEAIGIPISACGVPAEEYVDDSGKELPFAALNTNGEFKNGVNCGRWIEAKLGKNCDGGGNGQWSACDNGSFEDDSETGNVIHLYVSDMCPDNNFWCKQDPYHIDISRAFLEGKGLMADGKWNGRKLHWGYLDGCPEEYSMKDLKFIWKDGSKFTPGDHGFYASVAIAGVTNGLGKITQKVGDSWKEGEKLNELGQQWQLNFPDDVGSANPDLSFNLKVYAVDDSCYGEYKVQFNCDGTCGSYTTAPATRVGDC